MPRLRRFLAPGVPVHVTHRGNNRTETFYCDDDRLRFLSLLTEAAKGFHLDIHAFSLMSNHVHILATPRLPTSVSDTMQAVGRAYVLWFNRKHGRTGTLWEGRFRSTVVDTERYLLVCMRYIEENAPRAGMVSHPADYPWSSYRANALGIPDSIITPHGVFIALGNSLESRHAAYQRLFSRPINDQELSAIRQATHGAWALGDEAFGLRIEQTTGRRARPLRRCRRVQSGGIASKADGVNHS